jgi:hypothetical protein
MRTLGIFLLFLFFLSACTDRGGVPGNVIAKDSMASVMWDILQADQFSTYYLTKDSTKDIKKETMKLYGAIFQMHHVSRDEFQKSLQFYYSRPDLNKLIFDSLAARANRQRGDMYKSHPPAKKPDSGKNLPKAVITPGNRQNKDSSTASSPSVKRPDSVKNLPKTVPAQPGGHQPGELFKPRLPGKQDSGRKVFPTEHGGNRQPGDIFKPVPSKKILVR